MEFVRQEDVVGLLKEYGITAQPEGEDAIFLRMTDREGVRHFHLCCGESDATARAGARTADIAEGDIADVVEHLIQHLHIRQVIVIPVGKWRQVFDAVAFSMADNETWQEVDAAATVELNTRDPLICDSSDFALLGDLITALLGDAENPEQGFVIVSQGSPMIIEIIPDGALRISVGNQPMADEVAEVLKA